MSEDDAAARYNMASNPHAEAQQIAKLIGIDDATDLLLARNPRSTATMLEKLGETSNIGILTAIAAHPNLPTGDLALGLLKKNIAWFLPNPSLNMFLKSYPEYFTAPPHQVFGSEHNGSDAQIRKYHRWLLINGIPHTRTLLLNNERTRRPSSSERTTKQIIKAQRARLDRLVESLEPIRRTHLSSYWYEPSYIKFLSKCTKRLIKEIKKKPYWIPVPGKSSRQKSVDRTAEMIGGNFFTSVKHPWPRNENNGDWMQPIIQINLETIEETINKKFGKGILQIWARVCSDYGGAIEALENSEKVVYLRIIYDKDMRDAPTWDLPKKRAWDNIKENSSHLIWQPRQELYDKVVTSWLLFGEMISRRKAETLAESYAYFRVDQKDDPIDDSLDSTDYEIECVQDLMDIVEYHVDNSDMDIVYLGGFMNRLPMSLPFYQEVDFILSMPEGEGQFYKNTLNLFYVADDNIRGSSTKKYRDAKIRLGDGELRVAFATSKGDG